MKYAILRDGYGKFSIIGLPEFEYDEWVVIESGLSEQIAHAALKGLRDE